jgi:hypothetical protein
MVYKQLTTTAFAANAMVTNAALREASWSSREQPFAIGGERINAKFRLDLDAVFATAPKQSLKRQVNVDAPN